MKSLLFGLVLSCVWLPSAGHSAEDSVGVFYKPEKVIVLINEINGAYRLNGFMNAVGAAEYFTYESSDKLLRIECGRRYDKAGCTFRLLDGGAMGKIDHRNVEAFIPISEINIQFDYEMRFESSREDKFHLKLDSNGLRFFGSKKN